MIRTLRQFLVLFCLATASFGLIYFYRGVFNFFGLSDAALIPGMTLLSIAGLTYIFRTGIYDVPGYGLSKITRGFKQRDIDEPKTIIDYKEKLIKKRLSKQFNPLPLIVIGLLFVLMSVFFSWLATHL